MTLTELRASDCGFEILHPRINIGVQLPLPLRRALRAVLKLFDAALQLIAAALQRIDLLRQIDETLVLHHALDVCSRRSSSVSLISTGSSAGGSIAHKH